MLSAQPHRLKLIGKEAFRVTALTSFCLPEGVSSIGGGSFSECPLRDFVICDSNCFFDLFKGLLLSKDRRLCYGCIGQLEEVVIPDSVEELCESCFYECWFLSRVTFGESSSLKLIGKEAFYGSCVVEIHIPDSVEELCESCFSECRRLSRVTFGESSSLKLIGKEAFRGTGIVEIQIPDGVEELPCDHSPHDTRIGRP